MCMYMCVIIWMHRGSMYPVCSLVPSPIPAFQCCTLKNGRAWELKSCVWRQHIQPLDKLYRQATKGQTDSLWVVYSFCVKSANLLKRSIFRQPRCTRRRCSRQPFSKIRSNRTIVGPATHECHMILTPRPSRFSACNIEKLGWAWGRGYSVCV